VSDLLAKNLCIVQKISRLRNICRTETGAGTYFVLNGRLPKLFPEFLMFHSKSAGLTLLEVAILIVILGLAAILFIRSQAHPRERARRTLCASNMGQIHKAITMYEVDYSIYPTRAAKGKDANTDGDAQEALNLLYRQYIDDVRVFSCPSNKISPTLLGNITPSQPKGWPGAVGTCFKESVPGAANSLSTSYGYSPGHNSANSRVVILADHKGKGPKGNSVNHGLDAGQNVLYASGSVWFVTTTTNALGMGSSGADIIDSDIFSDNAAEMHEYKIWDSFCR
jgi:type II secretory pathway pseudopilin PulG